MRQRPKALGFALLLAALAALHVGSPAHAAPDSLKCRRACHDRIAACVAAGGRRGPCRKSMLGRCKREGVAVCQGQAGATTTSTTTPTTTTTLTGGGFLSGLVTDPTVVLTEPETPRPAYELPVRPTVFHVPIMRIANDPGLPTLPVSGTWGSDARHVYSKQQPWSADESLISIENSGGPSPLILDGFTKDRKSTRLNSSHTVISYAVFCLKKKKKKQITTKTPKNKNNAHRTERIIHHKST